MSLIAILTQLQATLPPIQTENDDIITPFQEYLATCESGNDPSAIGRGDIKITGYASRGLYQYQPKTFLAKGKEYGLFPAELTMKEAMLLIHSESIQTELTRLLIEDEQFGHWKNCYNKFLRSQKKGVPLASR